MVDKLTLLLMKKWTGTRALLKACATAVRVVYGVAGPV
jgi:hypothetical protein